LLAGLIALAAPAMARHFFNAPQLAGPLHLAGGISWFMSVNAVLTGALAGMGKFRTLGVVGLVSGALYIAVTLGCTLQWGVLGTAVGLMVSAATQTAALSVALYRHAAQSAIVPDVRHALSERAVLLRFALPASLSGLTTAGSLWWGQLILARQAGLVEVGLYAVALNLLTITMLTPSVANVVGMSMLNKAKGAGNTAQFNRLFRTNLMVSLGLAVAVAAAIALFNKQILLVFGAGFLSAQPALLALLLAAVPEALGLAYYQLLQSREHMWQAMRLVMLPRDLALPLLAMALVPSMGALGLALAYLGSRTIYLLTTLYATRQSAA
jgi:O-antigen/teichoic acid export membrane protein